jgi:septal ring factor EnvC (AmiA/AmiB activator)
MKAELVENERQVAELQKALERKNRSETELSAQLSAQQQALSRHQTTELELTAKIERLQGALDREKLHAQVSRLSQSMFYTGLHYIIQDCIA